MASAVKKQGLNREESVFPDRAGSADDIGFVGRQLSLRPGPKGGLLYLPDENVSCYILGATKLLYGQKVINFIPLQFS